MDHRTLTLLACLGAASCATANDCEHRAERNLDLDAGGVATLVLGARAGELDIEGKPGLRQVVVRGTACTSHAERLEAIRLTHRTDGDKLVIDAEIPDVEASWFGDSYQRLDLVVQVPQELALEVGDSSGEARIRGVAEAIVHDSSGDLRIEDVAGNLQVTDSSGDIDVRRVGGSLRIPADSSGDISVVDVAGDVLIANDSSGDIDLRQVRGDARIDMDSSGGIRFTDIDGSAYVGTDSSGSIEATRIGRDFTVRRDGSGGIHHRDVGGRVQVPTDD